MYIDLTFEKPFGCVLGRASHSGIYQISKPNRLRGKVEINVVSSVEGLAQEPRTTRTFLAVKSIGASEDGSAVVLAVVVYIPDLRRDVEIPRLLARFEFYFGRKAEADRWRAVTSEEGC